MTVHDSALHNSPIRLQALPHGPKAKLIETAERGQIRGGEGSVGHVEVFRMDGVGTSILEDLDPYPVIATRDTATPSTAKSRFRGPIEDAIYAIYGGAVSPDQSTTIMGSYRVFLTVESTDREAGTAEIYIEIVNSMNISSFTRHPDTGYSDINAIEEARRNADWTRRGHFATIEMVIIISATIDVRYDP